MRPVLTKRDMYARLAAGEFGNTIPQYFSLKEWLPHCHLHLTWGVRSTAFAGDKRCWMNVWTSDVPGTVVFAFGPDGNYNISGMIDQYATLRAEVVERPGGIQLYYVEEYENALEPGDHPWRDGFRKNGRHASGLAAWYVLKRHLWPGDVDDLRVLLDRYPDHAIELSACWKAVGRIPTRNAVIWEVRRY